MTTTANFTSKMARKRTKILSLSIKRFGTCFKRNMGAESWDGSLFLFLRMMQLYQISLLRFSYVASRSSLGREWSTSRFPWRRRSTVVEQTLLKNSFRGFAPLTSSAKLQKDRPKNLPRIADFGRWKAMKLSKMLRMPYHSKRFLLMWPARFSSPTSSFKISMSQMENLWS